MRRKQTQLSGHGVSGLKGAPLKYPLDAEERSFLKWRRRGFPKIFKKHPVKLSKFGVTGLKEQPIKTLIKKRFSSIDINRSLDEQKKEFEGHEKELEYYIQIGFDFDEREKEYFTRVIDILGDKKIPWFIRKKKLEEIEEKYGDF